MAGPAKTPGLAAKTGKMPEIVAQLPH